MEARKVPEKDQAGQEPENRSPSTPDLSEDSFTPVPVFVRPPGIIPNLQTPAPPAVDPGEASISQKTLTLDTRLANRFAPSPLPALLTVFPDPGSYYELEQDRALSIGRDPRKNDLVLFNASVSSKHCELMVDDDEVSLVDLNSSNGTWVNGERVENRILKQGDLITIGRFVFMFLWHRFMKVARAETLHYPQLRTLFAQLYPTPASVQTLLLASNLFNLPVDLTRGTIEQVWDRVLEALRKLDVLTSLDMMVTCALRDHATSRELLRVREALIAWKASRLATGAQERINADVKNSAYVVREIIENHMGSEEQNESMSMMLTPVEDTEERAFALRGEDRQHMTPRTSPAPLELPFDLRSEEDGPGMASMDGSPVPPLPPKRPSAELLSPLEDDDGDSVVPGSEAFSPVAAWRSAAASEGVAATGTARTAPSASSTPRVPDRSTPQPTIIAMPVSDTSPAPVVAGSTAALEEALAALGGGVSITTATTVVTREPPTQATPGNTPSTETSTMTSRATGPDTDPAAASDPGSSADAQTTAEAPKAGQSSGDITGELPLPPSPVPQTSRADRVADTAAHVPNDLEFEGYEPGVPSAPWEKERPTGRNRKALIGGGVALAAVAAVAIFLSTRSTPEFLAEPTALPAVAPPAVPAPSGAENAVPSAPIAGAAAPEAGAASNPAQPGSSPSSPAAAPGNAKQDTGVPMKPAWEVINFLGADEKPAYAAGTVPAGAIWDDATRQISAKSLQDCRWIDKQSRKFASKGNKTFRFIRCATGQGAPVEGWVNEAGMKRP